MLLHTKFLNVVLQKNFRHKSVNLFFIQVTAKVRLTNL